MEQYKIKAFENHSISKEAVVAEPEIRGWSRLEGTPRSADYSRSVRAEIRDPMWMIARQWQFGEFQGEDASSPVFAVLNTRTTALNRFACPGDVSFAYDRGKIPLETLVEREPLPADDWSLQIQGSRLFFKLLSKKWPKPKAHHLRHTFSQLLYPLKNDTGRSADEPSLQVLALASQRAFNIFSLWQDMEKGALAPKILPADLPDVESIAAEVKACFDELYYAAVDDECQTWQPSRLEYQFAAAAEDPETGQQRVLRAEAYTSGRLDWYSFDLDDTPGAALPDPGAKPERTDKIGWYIPAPVSFGGMPSPRFWEMEDRRVNLGELVAHGNDLAKMLFLEFALLYSDDWSLIPFDLGAGSLCDVLHLVVQDNFGEWLHIRPSGFSKSDSGDWGLFRLHKKSGGTADATFFLPPSVGKMQESEPVEQVNFLRDEGANMVWAVENTLPGLMGRGRDATDRSGVKAMPAPDKDFLQYVFGTDVPKNWIPYVPVQVPGTLRNIKLAQAEMPVTNPNQPLGALCRESRELQEEEVPRAGKIVRRSWQRTRWLNGQTFVWLGRRAMTGKGEGWSGLVFDRTVLLKGEKSGG